MGEGRLLVVANVAVISMGSSKVRTSVSFVFILQFWTSPLLGVRPNYLICKDMRKPMAWENFRLILLQECGKNANCYLDRIKENLHRQFVSRENPRPVYTSSTWMCGKNN